ncbi:PopZ family protein [Mesorhizobium sp. WSM2239]|uniref:PopZ family protein n=2 Tax=unclassified Mesorhizobium TaxID=325217 RepID=A0AAU8D3N9_9HYPH
MAQAGSAQREPSMEEILASIRRIIEDSDTGRKPGDETARAELDAANSAASVYEPAGRDAAPVQGEGAVIEVDAFRAELRAPNPAPEPRKPVTLAEVQAQIAADARKRAGETMPAAEPEAAPAIEPARENPQPAEAPAQPHWREASAAPEASMALTTADIGTSGWERREDIAASAQPEASSSDRPTSATEPSAGPDLVGENPPAATESNVARPAIISEHAGRQVAAAFGELSEAFAARSKKTFDEMAEEMMRPMLQDWLDNNLPTLVERLVREEIERVARGAQ